MANPFQNILQSLAQIHTENAALRSIVTRLDQTNTRLDQTVQGLVQRVQILEQAAANNINAANCSGCGSVYVNGNLPDMLSPECVRNQKREIAQRLIVIARNGGRNAQREMDQLRRQL